MKIGIIYRPLTDGYLRYGEERFFKLKAHGYDALDYNLADTSARLYLADGKELESMVAKEKLAIESAGLSISQIHGPWRYPPKDSTEEERSERLEKMKKAALLCSLFGCENLVVHPIMPYGTDDLKSGMEKETWEMNLAFYTELVDFAQGLGVTVCLENMPMLDFSVATPEKIIEFVKAVGRDNFKVCLDTGHVSVFKELSVGDELRRTGSLLQVLHIHDNKGDTDAHLYPGKGIIDWSDFALSLDEIGFKGVYSLETWPSEKLGDVEFERESTGLCRSFKALIGK